jgi:hypothetical protein
MRTEINGGGLELMRRVNFRIPSMRFAISGLGTDEDKERSKAAGFRHHFSDLFESPKSRGSSDPSSLEKWLKHPPSNA